MIANWVISVATGVRLHDYGCSLKVFRAEVVKPLKLYGEMHRFLPAIASEQGVDIAEVVVNHRPRPHGRSKYGIGRTIRVVLDLLTVKFLLSYSTRPLQIFGLIGFAMGLLGTAITGWLAYLRLFGDQSIANRPLLLFGILLIFTGVQLVTLGLLAELQARTYHESQNKPTYAIREILAPEGLRAEDLRYVCLGGHSHLNPATQQPPIGAAGLEVRGSPACRARDQQHTVAAAGVERYLEQAFLARLHHQRLPPRAARESDLVVDRNVAHEQP